MSRPPFHIVFALFPGLTQLDFTGPHQFLTRIPGAKVHVASRAGGEIEAEGGVVFARTERLADIPACDLICVPGGAEATSAALDPEFIAQVRRLGLSARYVTSVCTGSLILGAAGLLEGRRATPDPGRVVRDGNVITGGGVTAGIDFALTVLAEVGGEDLAKTLQLALEYAPAPPFDSGRPETAPAAILEANKTLMAPMMPRREAEAREAAARLKGQAGT